MLSSPKSRLSSREPRDLAISRSHFPPSSSVADDGKCEELAWFAATSSKIAKIDSAYGVSHRSRAHSASGGYSSRSRTGKTMATDDRRNFSFFTSLGIRYTLDLQPAWRGQMRPAISHSRCLFCVGLSLAMVTSVAAQVKPVQYSYSTEQSCILGGKLSGEQCANAAANARAEFEEKALRFPSRDACQRFLPPPVVNWASRGRKAGPGRSPASISRRARRVSECWCRRHAMRQ